MATREITADRFPSSTMRTRTKKMVKLAMAETLRDLEGHQSPCGRVGSSVSRPVLQTYSSVHPGLRPLRSEALQRQEARPARAHVRASDRATLSRHRAVPKGNADRISCRSRSGHGEWHGRCRMFLGQIGGTALGKDQVTTRANTCVFCFCIYFHLLNFVYASPLLDSCQSHQLWKAIQANLRRSRGSSTVYLRLR